MAPAIDEGRSESANPQGSVSVRAVKRCDNACIPLVLIRFDPGLIQERRHRRRSSPVRPRSGGDFPQAGFRVPEQRQEPRPGHRAIHAGQRRTQHRRRDGADLRDLDLTSRKARALHKATVLALATIRPGLRTSAASPRSRAHPGYAFASGLAATSTLLDVPRPRQPRDLHGRCLRRHVPLVRAFAQSSRRDWSFRSSTSPTPRRSRRRSKPNTRLIWAETPTNPTLRCSTSAWLGEFRAQALDPARVDNTFATPILQRPLEFGAPLLHALGDEIPQRPLRHGRFMLVVCDDAELAEKVTFLQNAVARCRSVRQLPRAARPQDPAPAHEGACEMRPCSPSGLATHPESTMCSSGPRRAPAARARHAPDGGLRRHDQRLREGRSRRGAPHEWSAADFSRARNLSAASRA